MARALGVSVLAVLSVVSGLFFAFLGLVVYAATRTFPGAPPFLDVISLGIAAMGAASVVAGYGLWHLRAWAWWLAVAASVLGLASAFVPAYGWWNAVLPLVILVYLVLVKDDFRIGRRRPAGGAVGRKGVSETRSRAEHRQARRQPRKKRREQSGR